MTQRPDMNLIRAYCDGELTPAQQDALKRHLESHPEQGAQVERCVKFENQLRQRVASVLRSDCPAAPAGLKFSLAAALRKAADEAGATHTAVEPAASDKPSRHSHVAQRRSALGRLFLDTKHANVVAVAATLMLVAGAVLYGIFGRGIDEISRPPQSADLVTAASVYADQDHGRFTGSATSVRTPDRSDWHAEVQQALSEWLGSPVTVFDLSSIGFELIEAGQSEMPVPARSGHLRYQKVATDPGARRPVLSIFIIPDVGGCDGPCHGMCKGTKPGEWCMGESSGKCSRKVMRSTDGKLLYFVVCCDDRQLDPITGALSQAMLASSATGP